MLELIIADAAGIVLAAIISAVGVGAWRHRGRPRLAYRRFLTERRQRRRHVELDLLMSKVRRQAEVTGVAVAIKAIGTEPRIVTYVGGAQVYYWRDSARYRRAMQTGQTPLAASFCQSPPPTLGTWSQAQLRAWLGEHGEPV